MYFKRACALTSAIGLAIATTGLVTVPASANSGDDNYQFCQTYWQGAFDSFEACLEAIGEVQPDEIPPSDEEPNEPELSPIGLPVNFCSGRIDCGN